MPLSSRRHSTGETIRIRKDLNADALLTRLRSTFERMPDTREAPRNTMADALMAGFALFSLKDPSLLAFDERRNDETIKNLYHLGAIPSDTNMRKILDEVDPTSLKKLFKQLFSILQRGKGLEDMVFYDGHYLISNDGTGYFSSEKIHCEQCLQKKHTTKSGTPRTEYHHQFLGSVIVHPDHKEVIPLCPEPIQNSDGTTKNDCERNASKRLLPRLRREHPHLKAIIVEDALAANAPHLELLAEHDFRFIIGIKPKSHTYLYALLNETPTEHSEMTDAHGTHHRFRFLNNIALNESHPDTRVNVLEYWESLPNGKQQHFAWITDIPLSPATVLTIMRGGRARWKIENETFNTLKNQGYQFEHNFGHGYHNLSTVFALLMMLAFLVDQIQQKCCALFQAAWVAAGSKRALWSTLRSLVATASFFGHTFTSMCAVFAAIVDLNAGRFTTS